MRRIGGGAGLALGLGGFLWGFKARKDLREALAGIVVVEEGIAHQDAMDAEGLHLLDLIEPLDPALDHLEALLGDLLHQRHSLVPGGLPGVQVASHGADDVRSCIDRPLQLRLRCDLDHHVETLAGGELQQGLEAVLGQQGRHQVDGIGAQDLAFLDLVFLEDELAADQGDLHLASDFGEVLVVSEIEEFVGGHRQGPGPVLGQALGVGRSLVGVPDLSTAGITPRHFTQDGDSRLAELFLQGVVPLVGILYRHGAPLFLDFNIEGLEDGDFL